MRLSQCLLGLLLCGVASAPFAAADESAAANEQAGLVFFESKVRPVLVEHCYDCHSAEAGAAEGGLRVDSRAALRSGGGRGPAVVPGDPEASWLLAAAKHSDADLAMPPKQEQLPERVIEDLERWIRMGAPDPRDGDSSESQAAPGVAEADHWAYQAPVDPERPNVRDADWPNRELDFFILAALEDAHLAPSPDASPQTLLRRLHFDLVGLPPLPADVDRFQRQSRSQGLDAALAAETDRLLASPAFGERWGRHWMDVARFGESSGGEANISFPYAWRYRDYVIDAFNADMPFHRFLTEQIAGDLLPCDSDRQRARLLVATGFLAVGPKNLGEANEIQFRADVIDEQIDSVTRATMASSIACARCHDHKFDPYSMEDYYALAGIFASTETYFGTFVSPANRVGGDPLPLPEVEGQQIFHDSIPAERVAELKAELAALQQERREGMAAVRRAAAAGEDTSGIFTLRDALRIVWRSGAIEGQLEKVSDSGRALPLAMGVTDRESIVDAPLLERGDVKRPAGPVPRAFPRAIEIGKAPAIPNDQSGRLQLARWLTDPKHPLTARVFVNRVWHHLFGAGLVATVDNFGSTGQPPSHPELLDHLAVQFVRSGWSVKRLVREMVLSRTYRQASTFDPEAFRRDPDNRLLWRASKRRLEAEAIRDAMLAVSGDLVRSRPAGSLVGRVIGDRPISLIGLDRRLPDNLDGTRHRSVYLPVIRDRLPDVLDLFDFAEPSMVTGQRETTNVPLQGLYLMNSGFVQERSEALAARVRREVSGDRERIGRAFRLCFSRDPLPDEQRRALEFLRQESLGERASGDENSDVVSPPMLTRFCHALLLTAEFRNLD